MKNIQYIIISLLILILYNCQEDNDLIDTEKPLIQIDAPISGTSIEAGSILLIKASLSDNKALKAYRISIHEIHNNGEGHEHIGTPFEFDEGFEIPTGLTILEIKKEIALPEQSMAGHYYLSIFLVEQSSNEQKRFVEIEIEN